MAKPIKLELSEKELEIIAHSVSTAMGEYAQEDKAYGALADRIYNIRSKMALPDYPES